MADMQQDFIQYILSTVHAKQTAQSSPLDRYMERTYQFLDAIDWSQTWIRGLIGFHLLCFLTTICLRKRSTALSIYFFILLGMAALAQPLNDLGKSHWEKFASADYFDESGLFIVSVYAFPLIFNCFITLMLILKTAAGLLIDMKRAQIKGKKGKTE